MDKAFEDVNKKVKECLSEINNHNKLLHQYKAENVRKDEFAEVMAKADEATDKKIDKVMPQLEALPSRTWVKEGLGDVEIEIERQAEYSHKNYATKDEVRDQIEEVTFALERKLLPKTMFETLQSTTKKHQEHTDFAISEIERRLPYLDRA